MKVTTAVTETCLARIAVLWIALLMLGPLTTYGPEAAAEESTVQFKVEELVRGLGVPWGMTFLDLNTLLITERSGGVKKLDIHRGMLTRIKGAPQVMASGQGGLLDVAVAPNYLPGGWIYFTYSKPVNGRGSTTLARARLSEDRLTDWQELLETRSRTDTGRHYGSRIAFDGEGHLYFSVGDRGERPNGQDLSTHAGSILRLNRDGSIPDSNPFVDDSAVLPEIWSFGHRNPQGLSYDPDKSRLWSIEHGPRGGDEINLIEPGKNYGWPVVSHGKEYWGPVAVGESTHKAGMEQPVKVYIPSIAPGSLLIYSGKAFPQWQGNLLAGALKLRHLNRIELSDAGQAIAEERLLISLNERIRALVESPQGWIYFSTDSGRILRIRP